MDDIKGPRSINYSRAWISISLLCKSPLHIGAAESTHTAEQGKPDNAHNTLEIARGVDGRAIIPGSSLRGCLRTLFGQAFGNDETHRLFGRGGSEAEIRSGRLQIGCALADETAVIGDAIENVVGHARDPVSNAVQDNMLFQRMVVRQGVRFHTQIVVYNTTAEELYKLYAALLLIPAEALGGARRSGLGRFEALEPNKDINISVLDQDSLTTWLQQPEQQTLKNAAQVMPIVPEQLPQLTRTGVFWTAQLYPQSAFHLGTGTSPPNLEGVNEAQPRSTASGHALIPGTALKGALRAIAGRLLMSVLYVDGMAAEPARIIADRALDQLFGCGEQAGCLWVGDFVSPDKPAEQFRTFNAIDRYTGGTADGALYNLKAIYCERLVGELQWRPVPDISSDGQTEAALLQLLTAVLCEAKHAIYLGYGVGRGLGEMQLQFAEDGPTAQRQSDDTGMQIIQTWLNQHRNALEESAA